MDFGYKTWLLRILLLKLSPITNCASQCRTVHIEWTAIIIVGLTVFYMSTSETIFLTGKLSKNSVLFN
jgi:hypothetical protein